MIKRYWLLVVAIIFIAHGGAEKLTARSIPVVPGRSQGHVTLQVETSDASGMQLSVSHDGISVATRNTPRGVFSVLSLNDYGFTREAGRPQLPVVRYTIEVPHGASSRVEVIDYTVAEYALKDLGVPETLIPVQPSIPKIPGAIERAPFAYDAAAYGEDRYVLNTIAQIVPGGSRREHRFVGLEVFPVDYNPATGTIRVYSDIKLRIVNTGGDLQETQARTARYASKSFDALNNKILVRGTTTGTAPEKSDALSSLSASPEGYLIITTPGLQPGLSSFITEKQKTFEVTVATTTQTGRTNSQIKAYIQNAYNTWSNPPVYVLLVGDTDSLPNWSGSAGSSPVTDLPYAELDGSDYFPDVNIGRFAVRTAQQLQRLVNKILNPPSVKHGAFPASTDNHSISEGTQEYVIGNYFNPSGWTSDKLYTYTYDATTAQLRSSINAGRSIIAYTGHGSTDGWLDGPAFSSSDIPGLTNTTYPVVFTFACDTGDFLVSESYGEAWIRASSGAAAYVGSSVTSGWTEDDLLEKGLFKGWWQDNLTTLGPLLTYAKYTLFQRYGDQDNVHEYHEMYNILGDPAQELIPASGAPPATISVNLTSSDPSVTVGTQTVFTAAATGDVASVTFRINNTVVGSDATAPFTYTWTPSTAGQYAIKATAYSTSGDSAVSSINFTVNDIAPPPPTSDSGGYVVVHYDNFNLPDQNLPGISQWQSLPNQGTEGTMRIVSNAIEAYSTSSGTFGTVVWDSQCTAGTEASVIVRQKSGDDSHSSLMVYARMDSKDFSTGSGYRLRFWEETAGDDLLEIQKVDNGYANFVTLASVNHEVNVGDTLKFRVRHDANQTMDVYVNGALLLTSQDMTYLPSQWYIALRSCVFPTPARFDDFIIRSGTEQATGVGDLVAEMPRDYTLRQNYPNPFNPSTTISFTVAKQSSVRLEVFNLLGEEVATLVNGTVEAGVHSVTWNADAVPGGLYFCRLVAGGATDIRKMVLLK